MPEKRGGRIRRFLRREPTQARSRALVDSVLVAFDQLLRSFGDERKVTIERVLGRAGVSLASFYEYFSDRDSLIGAFVERATRENFQTLLAAYDAQPAADIDAALWFFADRVTNTYLDHPARSRIWLAGVGRLHMLKVITTERDRFARELAARAKPLLPARTEPELVRAMITICDALIGIVAGEIYRDPPRPRSEVVATMVDIATAVLES